MARQTKDINKDVIALVRQIQRLIPLLESDTLTGVSDPGNSTDETLGAGGTFTGEWTLVTDRVQAAISIAVDTASAADGLVFEHSADGVTAIHSHSYALGAGQSRHFDEPLLMDFFRVRYTDGGAGGDLVLQTKLFKAAPTSHAHALSETFNAEHGANIVRSILSGFDVVGGLSKNVNTYETVAGIVALLSLLVDPSGTALRFYTEDGAKVGNAVGIAPLAMRQDTLVALTPADGDWVSWKTNSRGALWTSIDGTVTVTGSVTTDTEFPPAVLLADNLANPTTPLVGSCLLAFDGAAWDRLVNGGGTEATALRVTIATDSTGVLSVDDNGASITVDSLQLPAALAAGGGLKVEGVVGGVAVPISAASGTFASGALASGSVASGAIASGAIAAGAIAAGATSIAANEDDASANADRGVKILATRKATPANTSNLDGDYEFLQMSAGRLWVSAVIDTALPAGTALIGKVGIDQTTPGTTNAVATIAGQAGVAGGSGVVSALTQRVVLATDVSLPLTTAVTPAGFSVNSASASATYATALSSDEWRWLEFLNKTDTDFAISYDASTQHVTVPAGTGVVVDLYANGLKITATVSYKYLTAPTRGDFYVNGMAV